MVRVAPLRPWHEPSTTCGYRPHPCPRPRREGLYGPMPGMEELHLSIAAKRRFPTGYRHALSLTPGGGVLPRNDGL